MAKGHIGLRISTRLSGEEQHRGCNLQVRMCSEKIVFESKYYGNYIHPDET